MIYDVSKLTLVKEKSNDDYKLYYLPDRLVYITLSRNPTSNCQLFSVGQANIIFEYENALEILAFLYQSAKKNRLLIDVETKYTSLVEKVFSPEDIVFKDNYVNSQYFTKMTMFMLKTDKIAEYAVKALKEKSEEERKAHATLSEIRDQVQSAPSFATTSLQERLRNFMNDAYDQPVPTSIRRGAGLMEQIENHSGNIRQEGQAYKETGNATVEYVHHNMNGHSYYTYDPIYNWRRNK